MSTWISIAQERLPKVVIHKNGRYAVVACDGQSAVLAYSESDAHAYSLGGCHLGRSCRCEHRILDLLPTPVPRKCAEIGYE